MPGHKGDEDKTIEDVLSDGDSRMGKAVEVLKRELSTLRTGRATPALLENIEVDYYGVSTPLKQIATISAPEARLITVQVWDKGAVRDIEKSLLKSDMGFNPSNDGIIIKVPIPPLSQERRKELVRVLKRKVEDSKLAVRNVRRDAMEQIRTMERNKIVSQDENHRGLDQLQKTTDSYISQMDQVSTSKETEMMEV